MSDIESIHRNRRTVFLMHLCNLEVVEPSPDPIMIEFGPKCHLGHKGTGKLGERVKPYSIHDKTYNVADEAGCDERPSVRKSNIHHHKCLASRFLDL